MCSCGLSKVVRQWSFALGIQVHNMRVLCQEIPRRYEANTDGEADSNLTSESKIATLALTAFYG